MATQRINYSKLTAEQRELLLPVMRAAAGEGANAHAARLEIAQGLTLPLQQGVLDGDIFTGIYEPMYFEPGTSVEFPYDLLAPGTEGTYSSFVIPRYGELPSRSVESDYVMVPLYEIGTAIDCSAKYLRDARWDVLGRMLEILESMFLVKLNTDAWRLLIRSAVSRNLLVYDDAAAAGLFTKRLVANMELYMRRNSGGNSASVNRHRLTDLYISPEAQADTLSWSVSEIPDSVRATIFANGVLTRIGSTNLHALDELGVGQEYELFWDDTLAQSHTQSKTEIVVGLDQSKNSSLLMPWRQMPELYEDMMLAKHRRVGMYGTAEIGFAALDNRVVLLGQY